MCIESVGTKNCNCRQQAMPEWVNALETDDFVRPASAFRGRSAEVGTGWHCR
jgi:hypothetical protein